MLRGGQAAGAARKPSRAGLGRAALGCPRQSQAGLSVWVQKRRRLPQRLMQSLPGSEKGASCLLLAPLMQQQAGRVQAQPLPPVCLACRHARAGCPGWSGRQIGAPEPAGCWASAAWAARGCLHSCRPGITLKHTPLETQRCAACGCRHSGRQGSMVKQVSKSEQYRAPCIESLGCCAGLQVEKVRAPGACRSQPPPSL